VSLQRRNQNVRPQGGLRERDRNDAVQIVTLAFKEGMFFHVQDNIQIAGPPNAPASPRPVKRIRVPSSTPGGTLASTTRSRSNRPSPLHFGQGSVITLPAPWQVGQVRAMLKKPC